MMQQQDIEAAKHVADTTAVGTTVGVLLGWLPHIATVLTVLWLLFRLYDMWLSIKIKRKQLKG